MHLRITSRPFQIFSKIRGDICGLRCKWKISSSRKILIILFGHFWVVELTYISIFAFKFTLRYLQPNIAPIILPPVSLIQVAICHRRHWHRRQICRLVDTGGKFATGVNNTSRTGGKICRRCRWYRWQICRRYRWYRWQFRHQCHWHRWQICHRCQWHRCTLTGKYLC
jgi:hypothetical protein